MTHTTRDKTRLLNRVRRLRGQVEAIERALDDEKDCGQILHLVAAVRGATNGLMVELLEDHIRFHVVDPRHEADPDKSRGAADLIDVVRAYLK
ncbi:metal/formaldehyde-sensitive transcriptional repressor [Rhodanobacter glycinis]|uniref:DNA-binding transcriptional regulator, FrmR family n=1 Tax=Rhodanobacter glycinis TaxID=582702 RepID=A0A1I4BNM6_9GAMM|nr:metal/formaldehyde-sensitive transcriptional repressor [Rhodanobacter glycinis]TAM22917.1 MAG: metal/formaldehyde-sensitive transcriptional repressor [Rhodanobacter sp.]SFK69451.1 DNA-binding transcriptional regulator, FrmR family [Rhodanobacter glycinis]